MSASGQSLYDLMAARELTRQRVAELLRVSAPTVDAWLAPQTAGRHRNCPEQFIELLDLKTRE